MTLTRNKQFRNPVRVSDLSMRQADASDVCEPTHVITSPASQLCSCPVARINYKHPLRISSRLE
eukprot:2809128-Pyramimonas_sp.AAC.1